MLTTLQQAIRERELGLATNHTKHMHMKYNLHCGSIYNYLKNHLDNVTYVSSM
jgi:hypothetical protein